MMDQMHLQILEVEGFLAKSRAKRMVEEELVFVGKRSFAVRLTASVNVSSRGLSSQRSGAPIAPLSQETTSPAIRQGGYLLGSSPLRPSACPGGQ
jgi:hypothetical protein